MKKTKTNPIKVFTVPIQEITERIANSLQSKLLEKLYSELEKIRIVCPHDHLYDQNSKTHTESLIVLPTKNHKQEAKDTVVTSVYDIIITDPGDALILLVKELRDTTKQKLKVIDSMLDGGSLSLGTCLSAKEANDIKHRLEKAGATVQVVQRLIEEDIR